MNRVAHLIFLFTAVAPMFAVFGVNRMLARQGQYVFFDVAPLILSVALVLTCWALLRVAVSRIENQRLLIKSAKNIDRELIPFLIAYILPFAIKDTTKIAGNTVTLFVVVVLAAVLAVKSQWAVVNPIVTMLGYRCYEVQAENGLTIVLLSRGRLLSGAQALDVHQMFDTVFVRAAK